MQDNMCGTNLSPSEVLNIPPDSLPLSRTSNLAVFPVASQPTLYQVEAHIVTKL